jgi:uncharacterized protein
MTQTLPVFPLPELVLFPKTHLPLHLFEDRYCALIQAVLEQYDGKLLIGNIRDGHEAEYFSGPPLYRTMTLARVLFADKLEDGRWNILVEGIQRVQFIEELESDPFRTLKVRPLVERIEEDERAQVVEMMRSVANLAKSIGIHLPEGARLLTNLENNHKHPSIVADIIAACLVTDGYARQSLLEEGNILRRFQLLNVQLAHLVRELRENGVSIKEHPFD